MKFAAIVPPGCEDLLLTPDGDLRTGATLMFANVAYHNTEYRNAYAAIAEDPANIVLMDNEIYEGGETLMPATMALMVEYVRPTHIIVPDIRGDAEATMRLAWSYIHSLRQAKPTAKLLGVVQAQTVGSIEEIVRFWSRAPVDGLAIPMRIPGRWHTRASVARMVAPHLPKNWVIHFLGVERYPYNGEYEWGGDSRVVSCDTAEPTTATLNGVELFSQDCTPEMVKRPADFMTNPAHVETLHARKALLWLNFERMSQRLDHPVTRTVS